MKIAGRRLLAVLVSAAVVGSIVVGLSLIDPPGVERQRKLDARRVEELDQISAAVDRYRMHHGTLPPDLDALANEPGVSLALPCRLAVVSCPSLPESSVQQTRP